MKSSDEHMELIRLYLSGEAAKEDVTALESLMLPQTTCSWASAAWQTWVKWKCPFLKTPLR